MKASILLVIEHLELILMIVILGTCTLDLFMHPLEGVFILLAAVVCLAFKNSMIAALAGDGAGHRRRRAH